MGINTDAVQRLYVAYFNRPADPIGLAYWEGQLSSTVAATQAELTAIAAGFSGSAEYAALYAGQSNAQIIDNLYLNLFARNAEPAGLIYWAGQLTSGTQTFAQIALQLTYSAQGTDADAITNKLAAATTFTTELDTTAEIIGYSGTAAATSARTWLATVTDVATTLTTATAGVATAVTSAGAEGTAVTTAGTTFTLTTGMDSIVGGSSADSIYGTMSTTPTLDPFDIIDGGAGTDTFNLTLNGASYDANSTISNIEVINIRASTDHDFNANGLTGVTSMTLEGSVGASKFTNVGSAATAVGMKNISDSTADLQVWFADAALTATNDTVTVNLNSAGNTAANAPDILIRTTASANGAENLSVATSTTASNLGKLESTTNTGTGAANSVLKTLTISGAADLTVATAIEFAGSTGTVDASTFTGALDIGLDTGGIVKVTGGTGGDTFA